MSITLAGILGAVKIVGAVVSVGRAVFECGRAVYNWFTKPDVHKAERAVKELEDTEAVVTDAIRVIEAVITDLYRSGRYNTTECKILEDGKVVGHVKADIIEEIDPDVHKGMRLRL